MPKLFASYDDTLELFLENYESCYLNEYLETDRIKIKNPTRIFENKKFLSNTEWQMQWPTQYYWNFFYLFGKHAKNVP